MRNAESCVHSYEFRSLRLCRLNDMICDEDDVENCVNYKRR